MDSVEAVQLLTPDGDRVEHEGYEFTGSDEVIAGYLRDMVLVRRLDSEATALQRQGQLGLWASLRGQEAAQIGSGRAFGRTDFAFPSYRELGVAWTKGMPLRQVMSQWRGVDMSHWDVNETTYHMNTLVIGAHTLHAVGYGMGLDRDGLVGNNDERDSSVTVYFGDGATSQGDTNEAFVFAASYNAPVVFFCQNNQWAISEPITRQTRVPLYQRAQGFGFPGVRVDGNDVLAVHAVTTEALKHARSGNGPMLIEAFTYRMNPHTTSDDPTKYQADAERESWQHRDPIDRVAAYLRKTKAVDEKFFTDLEAEADDLAAEMRAAVLGLPNPDLGDLFDYVYAEQTPYLADQQQQYREYAASFEEEA